MKRKMSGSAVPRQDILALKGGRFVVRWADQRVQDLLNGEFAVYDEAQFSHQVTDTELLWLKASGTIEHFSRRFVWLHTNPQDDARPVRTLRISSNRIRAFYIATQVPHIHGETVQGILQSSVTFKHLQAQIQNELVTVHGDTAHPLVSLQAAEDVLHALTKAAPNLFQGASIAVFELAITDGLSGLGATPSATVDAPLDTLDWIHITRGKKVLIVGALSANELSQVRQLIVDDLQMTLYHCLHAKEAVPLLEDHLPDLAIIDLNLPDLHGWALVKKIREIRALSAMALMVLSVNPDVDEVFALKVAQVAAYLTRPFTIPTLKGKIILTLRAHTSETP